MSKTFLIVLCILNLKQALSILDGNCHLEGVDSNDWITTYENPAVNDTEQKEFKRFSYENITSVEVQGIDYGKYFDARFDNGQILIAPSEAFQNYEKEENNTEKPKIHTYLIFQCTDGIFRVLAFYQPINDINMYTPEFTQISYVYKVPMPLPANFNLGIFGDPIIACDPDISSVYLDFKINPSDFSITWGGPTDASNKSHVALLRTRGWLRLSSNTDYEVTVTDMGDPSKASTTTLRIEIDQQKTLPLNPDFESAYYTAVYDSKPRPHRVEVDSPIRLKKGYEKIKLSLLGEYKEKFTAEVVTNEIVVSLIEDFSEDALNKHSIALITIQAVLEHAEAPGRAVVVIYLPKRNCSAEESQSVKSIKFERENYWFECHSWYFGFLGFVKATVVPEQDVKYSLEGVDGSGIEPQIEYQENTGMLVLNARLNRGRYTFIATAEGTLNKMKTQTVIVISSYEQHNATINSFIVHHIEENKETSIELPCPLPVCKYKIISQHPQTNPWIFRISDEDHTLYGDALNRQMEIFEGMEDPQFTLQLYLTHMEIREFHICSKSANGSSLASNGQDIFDQTRQWVFIPSEVPNMVNQMFLVIFIDDVNNNPPVFEVGEKLIVGYPTKKLAFLLEPSYLTKVQATDLDYGINAAIRYSTNSAHFTVHPKTGIIYPKEDAFDDCLNLKFTVTATDVDGDVSKGLSADLEIEVVTLQQQQLTLVTFENMMLEDLAFALQNFSNELNVSVRSITNFPPESISSFEHTNFLRTTKANYTLKVVVYALNGEDEPVGNEELQRLFKNSDHSQNFTAEQWKPTCSKEKQTSCIGDSCDESSTIYFVISVAVLVTLLGASVTATVVGYFFRISALRKAKMRKAKGEEEDRAKKNQKCTEEQKINNN